MSLLPLGGLGPHHALIGARFVMVAVGTGCIALVGLIAYRRWGLLAGAAGAAVYACFPEAVQADHGVFLEPLLNLFCLAALACWLRVDDREKVVNWDGWALAAGVSRGGGVHGETVGRLRDCGDAAGAAGPGPGQEVPFALVGMVVTGLVLWAPVLIGAADGGDRPGAAVPVRPAR